MLQLTWDAQLPVCRALGGDVALDLHNGLPLLAVRRPSELRLPLRPDEELSYAFLVYLAEEIAFALDRDRVPPVAEGFRLRCSLDAPVPDHSDTAAALIRGLPAVELALLEEEFGATVRKAEPIAWEDIGVLYRSLAEDEVRAHGAALTGISLGAAAEIEPRALRPALRPTLPHMARRADSAEYESFARFLVAQAALAALAAAGWTLDAPPGLPVTATDGTHRLTPSTEIGPGWRARCDAAGVATLRLSAG